MQNEAGRIQAIERIEAAITEFAETEEKTIRIIFFMAEIKKSAWHSMGICYTINDGCNSHKNINDFSDKIGVGSDLWFYFSGIGVCSFNFLHKWAALFDEAFSEKGYDSFMGSCYFAVAITNSFYPSSEERDSYISISSST